MKPAKFFSPSDEEETAEQILKGNNVMNKLILYWNFVPPFLKDGNGFPIVVSHNL